MGVLIDLVQDVRVSKKKFYQDVRYKDYADVTKKFIKFMEKSGQRSCECKDAYPKQIMQTLTDGTVIPQVLCSKCQGSFYVVPDFSFVMLILGRKGGGKTTSIFTFTDLLHTIDENRKIKLWQCPPNLISVLHNLCLCKKYDTICELALGLDEWKKYYPLFVNPEIPYTEQKDKDGNWIMPIFQQKEERYCVCKYSKFKFDDYKNITSADREKRSEIIKGCQSCPHFHLGKEYFARIERLDEAEFNDIIIIDEGIISVNAKEALTKGMRDWDKFLAIVRHKRICLFVLFQRFEVIKSLREMSDIVLYKSLPRKLIENEKFDKFIINNGDRIRLLKRNEGIILSDHQDFDSLGLLKNNVPYWYTKDVSMSYASEFAFVDHTVAEKKDLEIASEVANHIMEMDLPLLIKPNEQKALKCIIRTEYKDANPPITNKLIGLAIEFYCKAMVIDGFGQEEQKEVIEKIANESDELSLLNDLNIDKKKVMVFKEIVVNDRATTSFKDDPNYNLSKQDASLIFREVGKYLLKRLEQKHEVESSDRDGVETERRTVREAWNSNGYAMRSVGSGGERNDIPNPDTLEITNEGMIRAVQIKERKTDTNIVSFSPLTFNTEFKLINRLKNIAHKATFKCPHCLEPIHDVLKPDSAYLYLASKDPSEPILKEPLEYRDNKKSLKVDWTTKMVKREDPDMTKVKTPKLKNFLEGKDNIYHGEESLIEKLDESTLTESELNGLPPEVKKLLDSIDKIKSENTKQKEEELSELVNIDKLIAEVDIKVK